MISALRLTVRQSCSENLSNPLSKGPSLQAVFRLLSIREIRDRRVMDNQPECAIAILPVDKHLINNDLLATDGNLCLPQVHITHHDGNVAVDLNGFVSLDFVVVRCRYPWQLSEPFVIREVGVFTYKVRECASPCRPEVLWCHC